jgi:hypothetical protein
MFWRDLRFSLAFLSLFLTGDYEVDSPSPLKLRFLVLINSFDLSLFLSLSPGFDYYIREEVNNKITIDYSKAMIKYHSH